jgi:hypothetical protein
VLWQLGFVTLVLAVFINIAARNVKILNYKHCASVGLEKTQHVLRGAACPLNCWRERVLRFKYYINE